MNNINLLGRFTKDPEIRFTQSTNTMVANFTLAVKRPFAKEEEQDTDFINCVAWKKTAEIVNKYFKKGQQAAISGRLQTRNYEDEKGKHYITEVIVESIEFTDSKKQKEEQESNEIESDEIEENLDLPF